MISQSSGAEEQVVQKLPTGVSHVADIPSTIVNVTAMQ